MGKGMTGDSISWMIIAGMIILFLEVAFFSSGLIFSLFISAAMIYLGRKRSPKKWARLMFWVGIIMLGASLMNMITFKLWILAFLIYVAMHYAQSKKNPGVVKPEIRPVSEEGKPDEVVRSKPLFENVLFGQQKTPNHVYEWKDINIQAGIGDTVIDLSYTLLPKGETVIFIRNFIGNVQVLVPYELEVSIHHSVIAGTTKVFDHEEDKVFNQALQFKTPDYDHSLQKVKIFTSLIIGNLEVNRI